MLLFLVSMLGNKRGIEEKSFNGHHCCTDSQEMNLPSLGRNFLSPTVLSLGWEFRGNVPKKEKTDLKSQNIMHYPMPNLNKQKKVLAIQMHYNC